MKRAQIKRYCIRCVCLENNNKLLQCSVGGKNRCSKVIFLVRNEIDVRLIRHSLRVSKKGKNKLVTFLCLMMGETEFMEEENEKPKVWRLVLTGGPCAGKTTALARLSTFFENIGWKVYRVPESANILLSGGVNFNELTPRQTERFQENLLKTIIQIEDTYFDLAEESNRNCLVICDRGTMDASAYISCEQWNNILSKNGFDEVELRDNRYNQVNMII